MDDYILNVASQEGKIDWPGALQRSEAFPLDRSSVFSSLADAELYIQGLPSDSRGLGATSYAGQFISVYDETTKQVYPYLVQFTQNSDGSLKRVLTRVLLTGDAISSDLNTDSGASLDNISWFIVDGGSAFDAIYRLHNAVCSIRCIDQDTQEVLYTAEPLNGYYFTAYNINNDNNYYIIIADVSSVVEKLNWPNSDLYAFIGVNLDETPVINDDYISNGGMITYNYRKVSNTPVTPPDSGDETETKTASYTVTHYKYSEPVETQTHTLEVPVSSVTVPIIPNSLASKAGIGDFDGYILADPIPYSNEIEIPDGTEVIINYVKIGDVNRDRIINTEDKNAWTNWYATSLEDDYEPIYDINSDGAIDGDDFVMLNDLIASAEPEIPPEVPPEPPQTDYITFYTDNDSVTLSAKGNGTLTVKNGEALESTVLDDKNLTSITLNDINSNDSIELVSTGNLTELDLSNNGINQITFNSDNCSELNRLSIHDNNLEDLDVSNLTGLQYFHIYNNPIITNYINNKTADNLNKIKTLVSQLPDRNASALGSIILYPWYGLETLIYKADGNHYKTPAIDFVTEPNNSTEKVAEGTLCKYPRRLRFVAPDTGISYNKLVAEIGTPARENPNCYYTDEPLVDVFYNSTNQEDPARSYLHVRNGIEYESDNATNSIIYAIVENYDTDNPSTNSDKSTWKLNYVTYDKSGNEIPHILNDYNNLREVLEKDITINRNWFFGSAIQDTEEYKYCGHYFTESHVQDIWETTQKGFGLTWGFHDNTSSCQPDWRYKNVIRFANYSGNTLDADVMDSGLSKPTLTDDRHIGGLSLLYHTTYLTPKWSPGSIAWGHGDHIASYITSHGLQKIQYNNVTYEDTLYGICPNASMYALDRASSMVTLGTFAKDFSVRYESVASSAVLDQMQKSTAADDIFGIMYRYCKDTSTYLYDTLTVKWTKDAEDHDIYTYVREDKIIKPEDETTNIYVIDSHDEKYIDIDSYLPVAMKDMLEHSDVTSLSWGMSSTPSYLHYLLGKFGERRFAAQSAGNSGDGCESTTDNIYDNLSPSRAYSDYDESQFIKNNALVKKAIETYHSTSFIISASTQHLTSSLFANTAPGTVHNNMTFADHMTGFGSTVRGYDNIDGVVSYINGTSMSCPINAGLILLMMKLYKVINPDYTDEPDYIKANSMSSADLKYENGLLTGGYGKFSPFMDYVKTHWMTRPSNLMSHQIGLGIPLFNSEPSLVEISEKNNDIPQDITLKLGEKTDIAGIQDNQKFTVSCRMHDLPAPNYAYWDERAFCTDVAIIDNANNSSIIGLRPGEHTVYLCDNKSAYGTNPDPLEVNNNNNWIKPEGFDEYRNTYHYYPVKVTVEPNTTLNHVPGNIEPTINNLIINTNSDVAKFTLHLKVKFDIDSLVDDVSSINSSSLQKSLISFYANNENIGNITWVTHYPVENIVESGSGGNLRFYSFADTEENTKRYKLALDTGFTTSNLNSRTTNSFSFSLFQHDNDSHIYETKDSPHVLTLLYDRGLITFYLDGHKMLSAEMPNLLLNGCRISKPSLAPTKDELFELNKNVLIYERCLTEEEIFKNVAYLIGS